MSRTVKRWARAYVNGYDLSNNAMSAGPLALDYGSENVSAMDWVVQGALPDTPVITIGDLNGIFDDTATSGIHDVLKAQGEHTIMLPIGFLAAPAQGDPVFGGKFECLNYQVTPPQNGIVTLTATYGPQRPSSQDYAKPWGVLLNALQARTGANSSTGVDGGGATTAGGWMMYQITAYAGTGSATISIDDSANNSTWAALSGMTSGAIAHTSMPCAGIVQLAKTATVRQYTRWQLSLSTLTSVTFALAFFRG